MRILLLITLVTFVIGCAEDPRAKAASANPHPISTWNKALLELAQAEDNFLTLKGVRAVAMMHIAIHDAVNAIEGQYAPYAYSEQTTDADPIAATHQAAFAVAINQYPDNIEVLTTLRDQGLLTVADGPEKEAGQRLGNVSARAIIEKRQGDGWNTEAEYIWHPMAPGVYAEFQEHSDTPQGFIFGAAWGKAKGFALTAADQFRAPPPPAITSEEYTRAFNEVKAAGRFQSMTRTADQTHLALWWKDFSESSHNRLARALVAEEDLSLTESARLFALINMSIYDAYVSVFDNKFYYNHWRPYTAIRWAANDENPSTEPEETWNNTHRHTYPFPSYPSAHGTACTAAMTAFADVFGDDFTFSMETATVDIAGPFSEKIDMQPSHRDFDRFSDAAMECSISRVYLGIHFRYDSIEGNRLGEKVGEHVINNHLLKVAD